MAGSEATCAGGPFCEVVGGQFDVSPGTSITGNFKTNEEVTTTVDDSNGCATAGLDAWKDGTAMTGSSMASKMRGVTFKRGVHSHESSINIALDNPSVYSTPEMAHMSTRFVLK